MKIKLIIILSLSSFIARSQDSSWKKISLHNNECVLFMPQATTTKDTSVVRDGHTTGIEVHNYSSDELELSMVCTEVIKPGDKNANAAAEVMNGFRKGMEKRALSMGLAVVIRDTVLAGKNCNVGIIKGPLATLYAYAVLHGRFFYVFTRTLIAPTDQSQADVKKFMNGISFSKEETATAMSSYETSASYKLGRLLGKLLIPVIIIVVIVFLVKGRNRNKIS